MPTWALYEPREHEIHKPAVTFATKPGGHRYGRHDEDVGVADDVLDSVALPVDVELCVFDVVVVVVPVDVELRDDVAVPLEDCVSAGEIVRDAVVAAVADVETLAESDFVRDAIPLNDGAVVRDTVVAAERDDEDVSVSDGDDAQVRDSEGVPVRDDDAVPVSDDEPVRDVDGMSVNDDEGVSSREDVLVCDCVGCCVVTIDELVDGVDVSLELLLPDAESEAEDVEDATVARMSKMRMTRSIRVTDSNCRVYIPMLQRIQLHANSAVWHFISRAPVITSVVTLTPQHQLRI